MTAPEPGKARSLLPGGARPTSIGRISFPVVILLLMPAVLSSSGAVLAADPFPGGPGTPIGDIPVGAEPSGAGWHARLEKLLVVCDGGLLLTMDADGSNQSSFIIPGDLEAVCVADPTTDIVYVGVEDPATVIEVDITTGQIMRSFVLLTDLPFNEGLEALTFVPDPAHPEGGLFYAGIQFDGSIHVFELPIKSSSTSESVIEVDVFVPVPGRNDLSGLHYDWREDVLHAIFDVYDLWRVMLTDGSLIDEWDLPGIDQEGIALGGCNLFIAEDGGDLWSYPFPLDPGDADGDGVVDCEDNCPQDGNAGQVDTDGDDHGDVCDDDDDEDGVPDDADNCPLDPNPDQTDTDSDDLGNACDPDDDDDGIPDGADNCPLTDNPDQTDTDSDGQGNACDPDDDDDGVDDSLDNCPLTSNPDQDDFDTDGLGDACDDCPEDPDNDADGDLVCGDVDNCPSVANPDQIDTDGDGDGDACDPDDDDDGVDDETDNCPLIWNPSQIDQDDDDAGDACDCAPLNGSVWLAPVDVTQLRLSRTIPDLLTQLDWEDQNAIFDVAMGTLGDLRADGGVFGATCLVDDTWASEIVDTTPDPGVGEGYYYLVRAENACGRGNWGYDSTGQERIPDAACF
jgi:hypothetical protein